jgi:hypothetical protein
VAGLAKDDPPDERQGLICEVLEGRQIRRVPLAKLDLRSRGRNRRMWDDYRYWFRNGREDEDGEDEFNEDEDGEDEFDEDEDLPDDEKGPDPPHGILGVLVLCLLAIVVGWMVDGAAMGAGIAAFPLAKWAICTGALLAGTIGLANSAFRGAAQRRKAHSRRPIFWGNLRSALRWAFAGAWLGVLSMAILGAVVGAVVGLALTWLLARFTLDAFPMPLRMARTLVSCGVVAQAVYVAGGQTVAGLALGAAAGLAVLLLVGLLGLVQASVNCQG